MKIDKWVEYTAMCDKCSMKDRDSGGRVYNTRKEAVVGARRAGWKVVKKMTLCPRCQSSKS